MSDTEFYLTPEQIEAMTSAYNKEKRTTFMEESERMKTALHIMLSCQTFTPGIFVRDSAETPVWKRKKVSHGDDCPCCGADVSLSIAGMYGEWHCTECGVLQNV